MIGYAYIEKDTNKGRWTDAEYRENTVIFIMLMNEGYSWCKAWNTIKSLGDVSIENNSIMQRIKAENIKGLSKNREEYIDKLWTIFRSKCHPPLELIREIRDSRVDMHLNGREWFSGGDDFHPSPKLIKIMNERHRETLEAKRLGMET